MAARKFWSEGLAGCMYGFIVRGWAPGGVGIKTLGGLANPDPKYVDKRLDPVEVGGYNADGGGGCGGGGATPG